MKRKRGELEAIYFGSAFGIAFFLNEVVESGDRVDPRLCFVIDIFSNRVVPVPIKIEEYYRKIDMLCDEIVNLWDAA